MAVIQIDYDTILDTDQPGPLRPANWRKIQDEISCERSIDEVVEEAIADAERRREEKHQRREQLFDAMLANIVESISLERSKPVWVAVECPLCLITMSSEEVTGHVGSVSCGRNLIDQRILEVTSR